MVLEPLVCAISVLKWKASSNRHMNAAGSK
jgi:hypothetical protein